MWLSKGQLPKLVESTAAITSGNLSGSAGIRISAKGTLQGVDTSVETIAQALSQLGEIERAAAIGKIGMLAHAHDSAALKQSIVDALSPTVGQAAEAFAQSGKKAA